MEVWLVSNRQFLITRGSSPPREKVKTFGHQDLETTDLKLIRSALRQIVEIGNSPSPPAE